MTTHHKSQLNCYYSFINFLKTLTGFLLNTRHYSRCGRILTRMKDIAPKKAENQRQETLAKTGVCLKKLKGIKEGKSRESRPKSPHYNSGKW